MAKKKSRAQRTSSAPKAAPPAPKAAAPKPTTPAAAAPKPSGRSPEAKGTRPKGPLKISGSANPQRLRASKTLRAAEPPSRLEINTGNRAERLGVAEGRMFGKRNTPMGLEWQRKAGGTDAAETQARLQNERFDRARAKVKAADARIMSATKKIQAKKNAASKPAAAAPKPAAPAPKPEGKTAPQLAKELRVRKAPGLVDQTNAMFRRAEQKARVMEKAGKIAGSAGKIAKGLGRFAGPLAAVSAIGDTVRYMKEDRAAVDKELARRRQRALDAQASETKAKSTLAASTKSMKSPVKGLSDFEFQRQNDFLKKVQGAGYKRTAAEQKAYDSIIEARMNPGSGKVGAKIVGRYGEGPYRKPGSKKM